jgi:hypothetical protein
MSDEKPKDQNEIDYPSVSLAYDLAVQSYDTAHKRWEAADNRVQTLLTFTVTVELALPTLLHSNVPQTRFNSLWFICAVVLYTFSTGIGTYARMKQGLILIDPGNLYNELLGYSEWMFKLNFIDWAGKDYKINNQQINKKITYTVTMLILFLIGNLLLVIWVIRALA